LEAALSSSLARNYWRPTGLASAIQSDFRLMVSPAAPTVSDVNCQLLFDMNPIPMWVVDRDNLNFLAVNDAALLNYGYTRQEFMTMTLADIRPPECLPELRDVIARLGRGLQRPGKLVHCRKDGSTINAEIVCSDIEFDGADGLLVAVYDFTALQVAENAAKEAEEKFRAIFDDAVIGVFRVTPEGRPLNLNRAMAQMHGYASPEELLKEVSNVAEQLFVNPLHLMELHRAAANGIVRDAEVEVYRKDRTRRWMRINLRPAQATSGAIQALEGTVEDITERKQAEEALLFKNALLEAQSETTLDGILAVDQNDRVVLVNSKFKSQFNLPDDLVRAGDDVALRNFVKNYMVDPETFLNKIEYLYRHPEMNSIDEVRFRNGKTFEHYSAPLVDSRGEHRGRIWYVRDITERKTAEEQVKLLAYYDALTGLPNRSLLMDRLENALAGARQWRENVAILFIDLDRFKIINDSLGHAAGDLLLKEVGKRLRNCVREQDTVARVGGDEFVILLKTIKGTAEVASMAARIVQIVADEIIVNGRSLTTTCSVGISMFPQNSADIGTLIKYADQAMYCAKDNGRNRFQFFTDAMNVHAVERLSMENELRGALERGEFFLLYQPQVDLLTGEITGLEALIRWNHPRLGTLSPDRFIPAAEECGLIVAMGEWVLRTACAQVREWRNGGARIVPVAVNVSAVQFRQENFCSVIRSALRDASILPGAIELELTESLLLSNHNVVLAVLRELKEIGVQLAIDDFGTGYSSLSYLSRFRVDKIKIDRAFIRDLATNPDDAAIAAAIIALGKTLKLTVVAEGVEDGTQVSVLQSYACDQAQGYFYSKPVPAAEIAPKLAKGPSRAADCPVSSQVESAV
jgi:diguanylate cyclase (GGDEF)-like protein/PAS domain S-box-containing protein